MYGVNVLEGDDVKEDDVKGDDCNDICFVNGDICCEAAINADDDCESDIEAVTEAVPEADGDG